MGTFLFGHFLLPSFLEAREEKKEENEEGEKKAACEVTNPANGLFLLAALFACLLAQLKG